MAGNLDLQKQRQLVLLKGDLLQVDEDLLPSVDTGRTAVVTTQGGPL
jgi:hypothetical protein